MLPAGPAAGCTFHRKHANYITLYTRFSLLPSKRPLDDGSGATVESIDFLEVQWFTPDL